MKIFQLLFALIICCITSFTASAQVPNYVPTSGLVAWYSFDNNVNDLSGNGNTPVNNGATFVADRFGVLNSALDFNGINAVMTVNAASFQFSETGEFTYSVWLKKRTQNSAGVVIMNGTNAGGNFVSIIQGQNVTQLGVNKQQSSWVWASCPHTLNVWDHYVATYSAGTLTVYKNGIANATATYTHTGAIAATLPIYFGRGISGATNFYNGSMDDIGIWTRALTQQEITGLYTFPIGINEATTSNDFTVYPNPAQDIIIVKLTDFNTGIGYTIFDQAGSKVLSGELKEEKTQINISELATGLYFLQTNKGQKQQFSISK